MVVLRLIENKIKKIIVKSCEANINFGQINTTFFEDREPQSLFPVKL